MLEARVFESIEQIGRDAWDATRPSASEGFDYLAAVEAAGLPGFAWRYLLVEDAGRQVAAAPVFLADYRLDATLTDLGRRMVALTRKIAPRAFTMRMACLGSPCTEDVALGLAHDLEPLRRRQVLQLLLDALEATAARENCGLLAVKDARAAQDELWSEPARAAGFQPTPGMPTAVLPIDFADVDGYLARLSSATRKDMRRKLKAMAGLRIEVVGGISGLEDRVFDLYRQTGARSDRQFEELTAAYFTGVLERLGDGAFCVLYWADEALIGFNLLLQDETTLLDKFFCMETARGPAFNLYFVSWFVNVGLCLERGLARYETGQVGYVDKLRLGCRLEGARMYVRHRQANLPQRAQFLAERRASMRGAA